METGFFLLLLSCIPGLGPTRINAIVKNLGCSPELLHATTEDFLKVPGIGERLAGEIARFLGNRKRRAAAEEAVLAQLEKLSRCKAQLLTITERNYPALLREIYDPPPYLFVRGSFPLPEPPGVAIVGTRNASAYGKRAAAAFSEGLTNRGVQIVSGLAYGIDQAAHEAAIRVAGRTIAVLASGLDNIYTDPRGRIWPKIVEKGAIISEEWFGSEPLPGKFPKRNRIISGMTHGTLVVESDLKGGALITASYALEQNREVFAVPGSIYSEKSRGTNRLIQTGQAKAVVETEDILDELNVACGTVAATSTDTQPAFPPLDGKEKALLALLSEEPVHLDTLAEQTGHAISELLVLLFELELKKAVVQLPGQFFRKNL